MKKPLSKSFPIEWGKILRKEKTGKNREIP
jgi:hypothetical protein